MRFTRFPRGEHQPSPSSGRRVAAAKRAVQAEKDRYPLFPELVRYATTESRLAAMQEHRTTWGMFQQRYVKRHKIWHKPHLNNEMWLFCTYQNQTAFRRPTLGA